MKIEGVLLGLLDIPADYTEDYNRWYDLDHLPEHLSKPDVVSANRYVADKMLREGADATPSDLFGGYPPYLTVYFLGGSADIASPDALSGWQEVDYRLRKAGRYWREGRGAYSGRWRLAAAFKGPSVLVSDAAVPHLRHRSLILVMGRAASPEAFDQAIGWWANTHLVDLFTVAGILGALRLRSTAPDQSDLILHLLLCEGPGAEMADRLANGLRRWSAIGRYPCYGGAYEPLALLHYDLITPFSYNFQVGTNEQLPGLKKPSEA